MPEVPVSQQDITKLRSRLKRIEPELSEGERALLGAILEIAANAIRQPDQKGKSILSHVSAQRTPVVVAADPSLPSLSDQFDRAFTAGALPVGNLVSINIVGGQ